MFQNVEVSNLRPGTVLSAPVYDHRSQKLLAAGVSLTNSFLAGLRKRQIREIVISEKDYARHQLYVPQGTSKTAPPFRNGLRANCSNDLARYLDEQISNGSLLTLGPPGEPFGDRIQQQENRLYDAVAIEVMAERHELSVETLLDTINILQASGMLDAETMIRVSEETLLSALDDLDLFVCLGINPTEHTYPGRHGLHVAMLAMSIGAGMGLDQGSLVDLALGCLLHDLGMLRVPAPTYRSNRVLDESEFLEITRHPVDMLDLLERNFDNLPMAARMVAYQLHERCNGSGYPRGRTAEYIHPLAKIAAVADTHVALATPRPHRPGMVPYYGMKTILKGVQQGLFDANVVRALLHTVSLFPIGSFVKLSDNRVGKVIRANSENYFQPIVEVWRPGRRSSGSSVLNLSQEAGLKVVEPLSRPD